jgi:hypothetical protein
VTALGVLGVRTRENDDGKLHITNHETNSTLKLNCSLHVRWEDPRNQGCVRENPTQAISMNYNKTLIELATGTVTCTTIKLGNK